nr:reverse transcriptase domain-containing protein [Tanacetum cinerariifolium]
MADDRTMAELLRAPTEGYEDAIVILEIAANNFELKHGLINLVQNKQFLGHDKEDPYAHIPISSDVAKLKDMVRALLLDKKNQSSAPASSSTPAPVKAVEPNCVTCGGSGTLPGNTITNPKENLKALNGNKEKLSEMARTPMNEHCSAVILNKLPIKLGDPSKFLIPYEFLGMDECLALADLGASINLMPLFVWEGLSLLELTLTCMTLELVDRLVFKPIGIAKDVSVKVGVFHFLADFVVVDFEPDPRVPLILESCFLKTGRALIDN